jgi:ribonucleoside-diphosphate reductase alpha chain
MDYLFRWMQLRFLSGQQLDLFAGMKPTQPSVPVAGAVTSPHSEVVMLTPSKAEGEAPASPGAPQTLEPEPHSMLGDAFAIGDRTPPQHGIAPDLTANSGLSSTPLSSNPLSSVEDRSIFHTGTAMASMYNMSDSPSCSTCGAIMTRNGSCYRCGECGSTSGCS